MTIAVEHATLADIPALIDLINEQLNPDGPHNIIPHDHNGKKYLTAVFEALISSDNSRATVLVIRDPEGTPVSTATVYSFDAGQACASAWFAWGIPTQEGINADVLDRTFGAWARRQDKLVGHVPRVFVEALATRQSWRRRGHAAAILAKADEIAARDDRCAYLDGMDKDFYVRRGYEVLVDESGVKAAATPMLRKKQSERC